MGSEILAIDLADDILSIQKLGFNFIVLTPPLIHSYLQSQNFHGSLPGCRCGIYISSYLISFLLSTKDIPPPPHLLHTYVSEI